MGTDPQTVTANGSSFTVFQRGDEVEAYRTSREWLPRQSEVFLAAEIAIEKATGCTVRARSMTGDQAIVRARVLCS
jgi:hypothetical protein